MAKRKSWTEKLNDNKGLPKLERFDRNKPKTWPPGVYVIPAPVEIDQIMRKIPKGKLITVQQIREELARIHGCDYACPITTGIFSWISAHAAQEQFEQGKKRITPWWRTLKTGGILNEKYPGGIDEQTQRLEAEGHTVIRKGKSRHFIVNDYERVLVKI